MKNWTNCEEAQQQLFRHLKSMADFFEPPMCPLERFILDCGTDYRGQKRPKGIRKQADKQCYRNSTTLCLRYPHLSYVEGFAVHNGLIPLFHAWCVDQDGKVVDTTWRYPERSVYRGFVIPHDILVKELVVNKVYGVLDHGMINIELIEQLRKDHKKVETAA